MLAVVDTNVVFSGLLSNGVPFLLFKLNSIVGEFEFISPDRLFSEMEARSDKIIKYTKYSDEEFEKVFSFLKGQIEIMPFELFGDKKPEAQKIAPHEEDVPFIALALKMGCKIISGDKKMKARLPDLVISPAEALRILSR